MDIDMYDVKYIVMEYLQNNTTTEEFTMMKNMVDIAKGSVSPVEFLNGKTKDNTWKDMILKVCDSWDTGGYEDFLDFMRAEGADPFYTEDWKQV